MIKKFKTIQHVVSDDVYMHTEPCIIHAISHSNPETSVVLTIDGVVEHNESKPSVHSFNLWGSFEEPPKMTGKLVTKWFRVEAPDAHCIVIIEPLTRAGVVKDESIGFRACPICEEVHTLTLDTNYIRCNCGTMFNGELR